MTWSALLKESGGPAGHYQAMLERMRDRAAQTKTGAGERALAGNDEALAALAALRGAAAARPFAEAAMPVISRAGETLAIAPGSMDSLSMLMVLSMTAVSETIRGAMPEPGFDVERRMDDLLLDKSLSKPDRVTLAFLSLGRNRIADVKPIVSQSSASKNSAAADPIGLIRSLAAALKSRAALKDADSRWDTFVRGFPAALQSRTAEWRHLLLAARIVLPALGRATIGNVADSLHAVVTGLAAEEPS